MTQKFYSIKNNQVLPVGGLCCSNNAVVGLSLLTWDFNSGEFGIDDLVLMP